MEFQLKLLSPGETHVNRSKRWRRRTGFLSKWKLTPTLGKFYKYYLDKDMLLLANENRAIAVEISVGPNEDWRIEQSRHPRKKTLWIIARISENSFLLPDLSSFNWW
jgi:hypothetical protein